MTALTLLHTGISLLPVGLGMALFLNEGRINPRSRIGKWYIATMLAGSLSALGFIAKFGFTPGQVLTLLTIALLAVGTLTRHGHWRQDGYIQTISLTTSFLLLMVFFTTETLKAFPAGQPFAKNADDPALIPVRLGLLGGYVVGLVHQLRGLHRERVQARRIDVLVSSLGRAA